MSILNVEHLTHGFGDRAIFADVSFRLLKGEHIGLVGANGEGKSTFLKAYEFFVNPKQKAEKSDFNNYDTNTPIEIIGEFLKEDFDTEKKIELYDFMLRNFDHRNFELVLEKFLLYWAKWNV